MTSEPPAVPLVDSHAHGGVARADLDRQQWEELTKLCERRGLVPFIDLAYQGLAEGLDEDAYGVRLMASRPRRGGTSGSSGRSRAWRTADALG